MKVFLVLLLLISVTFASKRTRQQASTACNETSSSRTRVLPPRKAKALSAASLSKDLEDISPSGVAQMSLSPIRKAEEFTFEDFSIFDELSNEVSAAPEEVGSSTISCIEDAIRCGCLESISSFIFNDGIDINISSPSSPASCSPFMTALDMGNEEVVAFLLSTGKVDPNIILPDNRNCLITALEHMGPETVELIITSTTAFPLLAVNARKILINAKMTPHFKPLVSIFIKIGTSNLLAPVHLCSIGAVIDNDLDLIRFLRSLNFPLNDLLTVNFGFEKSGLLHFAASSGHVEMIHFLLDECGCNTEQMTTLGYPAISFAYQYGHYDAVCALIQHGAVEYITEILIKALRGGNIQIVRAFATKHRGFSVNLIEFLNGFNLVTYAIDQDKPEMLDVLLENAFTLAPDSQGRSIFNMSVPDSASEELKGIIAFYQNFIID